ncbi:PAS domain S-box protein [Desertivirga arenae]|uniref:PAS domain S-box protein n=1 Tax=Desertivirga arenae TaxID=2810309 RepID=UPI001A9703A3|nr:PAS domain S-box protein [Pedobacter sp. SYSU D00823]
MKNNSQSQNTARLQTEEDLVRSIEEIAGIGTYEVNLNANKFYFSEGMYQLFGEEPFSFEPSLDFIDSRSHPNDAENVRQILERAAQDKQPYYYIRRIRRKDGEWRMVESHGKVITDAEGNAQQFFGVVQDITRRRSAENELVENKEFLRATIDSSLDMIQVFKAVRDKNGQIVDFTWVLNNKTSEQFYGDVIGKSLLESNPGVVGEGIFDTFKRVVETGIPDQSERRYSHEQFDGWFYQSTVKLNDGVATTTANITDRKNAEQEIREKQAVLESVLNNTESSIMLLKPFRNQHGHITDFEYAYANDRTLRSVNREVLSGKRMTQEFPELKDSVLLKHYKQVAETGKSFRDEVDISPYGYSVWAQVFAEKFGEGILVTYFDITERKKTEQQLIDRENLLRTVFEVSLNPIAYHQAVRDEKGDITDFAFILENREARKYALEDRIGQRYSEAYPGIKDTHVFKLYCDVVEGGQPLNTEVQLNLKGTEHWFHLMAVKLDDGLVATAVDITERKHAEQEILNLKDEVTKKATDKYKSLFNSIDEGFCIIELLYDETGKAVDYRWLEANPNYQKHSGIANPAGKLGSEVTPDTENYWLDNYDKVLKTGRPSCYENWHEPSGRWYRTYASRIGVSNSREIAVVFHDVTERKQREQQQQFLLNLSDRLGVADNLKVAQTTVTDLLLKQYEAGWCYYVEWDEEKNTGVVQYDSRREDLLSLAGTHDVSGVPEYFDLLKSGHILNIGDYENYELLTPEIRGRYIAAGFRSMLVASQVRQGKLISSLIIADTKIRNWSVNDEALLAAVAERTWAAVERAKAEEALGASEERLAFLVRLGDALRAQTDEEAIGEITTRLLGEFLNVDRCYLNCVLYEENVSIVGPEYRRSDLQPHTGRYKLTEFPESMRRLVMQPMQVDDFVNDPGFSDEEKAMLAASQIGALLVTPLRRGGADTSWRALTVASVQPRAWKRDEAALVEGVAERTWIALERAKAEVALRKSEEKYRTLFETIEEGFCIMEVVRNEQGDVIDIIYREVNKAFERHTGLANVVGKRSTETIPNQDPGRFQFYQRLLETGETSLDEVYINDVKRWLRLYRMRLGGPGSNFFAAVFEDITERKQKEQHQEFLLKFSDVLRAEPDADAIVNSALQMLAGHLQLDRCYVGEFLLDEDRGVFPYQYGNDKVQPMPKEGVRLSDFPEAMRITNNETLFIADFQEEEGLTETDKRNFKALGFGALVVATIRKGEKNPFWSICAVSATPRRWTAIEIQLLEEATERTWRAVERAIAEEALRKSEAKFRRLSDSGIVAVAFFDIGGPIVEANHAFLQMLGVTKDELNSEKVRWDVYTAKEWIPRTLQAIEEFQQTGYISPYEKQFYHSSGKLRWGIFTGATIGDGKTGVSLVLDITERKEAEQALRRSEEKFRTVFETIDEGFALMELHRDKAGKVRDLTYREVNNAFKRFTGWQDAVGKKGTELMPGLEQSLLDLMQSVADTCEPFRSEDYVADLDRWYDVHYSCIGGPGNNFIVAVFKDTTERKRQEQRREYLLKLSDAFRPLSSPKEIEGMASRLLGEALKCDRAFYADIHEPEGYLKISDDYLNGDSPSMAGIHPLSLYSWAMPLYHKGEPVVIENIYESDLIPAEDLPAMEAVQILSYALIPLVKNNLLVGTLTVTEAVARKWKAHEVQLLAETAERIWAATESVKAEEALKKSEEQFRRAIEDAPIPVIMHAEDGEVLQISRTWTELTGFTLADIRTFDLWLTRAYGEGADEVRSHMHDLFHGTKRTVNVDFPVSIGNGEVRYWSFSASSPGTLNDGRRFIVGMAVDITERVEAEKQLITFNSRLEQEVQKRTSELNVSNETLRSVLDTTFLSMSILKAVRNDRAEIIDFKIDLVNKELERETGRTDLVGKLYAQEYPGIKQTGLFDLMLHVTETGEPGRIEYYYPFEHFNKWYSAMFVKFDDGLVATNLDITERKQAEQTVVENLAKLKQAEEVAGLGSWEYDLSKKHLYWSDGMYDLFEIEPGTEVFPETYLEYILPDSRGRIEAIIKAIKEDFTPVEDEITVVVAGREKVLALKTVIFKDEEGKVQKVLGVDIDITERRIAEAKLRRAEEEKQKAILNAVMETQEEERRRIAEALHNEFGQLLVGAKLQLQGKAPAAEETLGSAIQLVRNISHELMPPILQDFGLESALKDLFENKFISTNIRYKLEVKGFRIRVSQSMEIAVFRIVQEILNNVVKHSKASRVTAEIVRIEDYIKINISDNGIGISEAKSKSKKKSFGLDYLSNRVHLMNGTLDLSSSAENGTTFNIIIPLKD